MKEKGLSTLRTFLEKLHLKLLSLSLLKSLASPLGGKGFVYKQKQDCFTTS